MSQLFNSRYIHVISCRRSKRVLPTPLWFHLHLHNPNLTTTPKMQPLHIKNITPDAFSDVLSRYPAMVPEKLRDLDAQRYDTIPAAVAAMEGEKHLTKDQVEKLVEWKLYASQTHVRLVRVIVRQETRNVSSRLVKPGPKQHTRGN